ncbi:MAG: uracil-DNA glycosylase [Bacteroidales bacterium]|nr:uracil-DNA glycosylase [Bacteroidales bacterium]
MEKRIEEFVEELARERVGENTTNQYGYDAVKNEIRRKNLTEYLRLMLERRPRWILVSEAPGYLGMKLTGVPFTSERILMTHWFYKANRNFEIEFSGIAEPSATIVWNVLDTVGELPLMFPAYPFHPNRAGEPKSNRTPTDSELRTSERYLRELIDIFKIEKYIAVGRKAETSLKKLGLEAPYVRHPANGGARMFREGIISILNS